MKKWFYILFFIPYISYGQIVCNWFDVEKSEMDKGTKIALVIGNNNYENINKLKNPVNDARLMKETFNKLGFDTILYDEDLNFNQMKKAVLDYKKLQSRYDLGFIYYAGHGVQDGDGNAYLIPVDWQKKKDIKDATISINKIAKFLASSKSDKNILILDACRSSYKSKDAFSKPDIVEPVNVKVGFSTSYGHLAYDYPELNNSLYTKTLSNYLLIPNLNIYHIFHSTWNFVYTESHFKQRPVQYFGELMDDININKSDCE